MVLSSTYAGCDMISFITALIAYVAVPVVGILWFDWDWRSVLLLYWLENVTAGVRNVISMARSPRVTDPGSSVRISGGAALGSRVGTILFFVVHYGLFTFVHGVFVLIICLGGFTMFGGGSGSGDPASTAGGINWGGLLLVWLVGSAVQIVMTCLEPRDRLPSVSALFLRPYGRIFALHVTVLGGVWLINAMGWPPIAAVLLVVLHFALDLAQLRRKRVDPPPAPPTGPPIAPTVQPPTGPPTAPTGPPIAPPPPVA